MYSTCTIHVLYMYYTCTVHDAYCTQYCVTFTMDLYPHSVYLFIAHLLRHHNDTTIASHS